MSRAIDAASVAVRGLVCAASLSALAGPAWASHVGEDLTVDQQTVAASDQLIAALRQYERAPQAQRDALALRLTQLATARKERLLALLERNPQLAAARLMPAAVRERLPAQAQAMVERDVGLTTAVRAVIADDFARGKSQRRLYVNDASGRALELVVAGAGEREQLSWVNKRATIIAAQLDGRLLVKDKRQVQLLAADGTTITTSTATGPASTVQGVQKTLAILLNFNDLAVGCTASDLQSRLFGTSGQTLDQGYRQSSGDLVSFTGNVVGPFTINYSSAGTCDYNGWASAATAAARAAGFDPANYTRVSYVTPRNPNCPWTGLGTLGGTPPTPTWIQQCTTTGLFSHELGHNLGFHHAATPGTEYGDASDPMGAAKLVQSNAPNRVMAGWLTGAQIQDVGAGGSYVVNALQTSTGTRVLRLPKRDTSEYYYVSLRQPSGVDANLWSTYQNTLSIHKSTGSMPAYTFLLASLAAGQTWTDSVNGIQITNQGLSGSAATVGVTMGGATCSRSAPSVSVSPASQSAAPGGTLAYSVSVTNKNSSACAGSTFNLSQVLPSGFAGSFGATSVTLAPGASSTLGWSVSSSTTSTDAVYTLSASAAESAVSNVAEAHATYTVIAPQPPVQPPADTTPPTLSITSPADGSTASGRFLTIAATASDASGVSMVQFFVDGKLITSDTSGPYSANWNLRKAGKGLHTIRVRAVDNAGNAAEQTISVSL